jgi:hypothetical protein
MRLDINLASRPYEDSSSLWVRWGGALAVLVLITIVLLYSALSGWLSADRGPGSGKEQSGGNSQSSRKPKHA